MFHSQDSEEIKMVSEGSQGEKINQHFPFCDGNLMHLVPFVTDLNKNMEPGMQEITLKRSDAEQEPLWGREVPCSYSPFSLFSVLFFSYSNMKLLTFLLKTRGSSKSSPLLQDWQQKSQPKTHF